MSTRAFKCLGIHLTNPMHKHKLSTEVLDHLSIWATGHWNVRNLISQNEFEFFNKDSCNRVLFQISFSKFKID